MGFFRKSLSGKAWTLSGGFCQKCDGPTQTSKPYKSVNSEIVQKECLSCGHIFHRVAGSTDYEGQFSNRYLVIKYGGDLPCFNGIYKP